MSVRKEDVYGEVCLVQNGSKYYFDIYKLTKINKKYAKLFDRHRLSDEVKCLAPTEDFMNTVKKYNTSVKKIYKTAKPTKHYGEVCVMGIDTDNKFYVNAHGLAMAFGFVKDNFEDLIVCKKPMTIRMPYPCDVLVKLVNAVNSSKHANAQNMSMIIEASNKLDSEVLRQKVIGYINTFKFGNYWEYLKVLVNAEHHGFDVKPFVRCFDKTYLQRTIRGKNINAVNLSYQ